MFSALWRYRHFVLTSILGDLRGRFVRSRLGLFWSILHPLAQATIFALVLAEVLGAKLAGIDNKAAYPIYLMAGMAAWGLFSEICDRVMLLDKGRITKDGLPDEVVNYYDAMIVERENLKLSIEQRREKNGWVVSRSGTFEATASSIELLDAATGEEASSVRVGQQLKLRIVAEIAKYLPRLALGIMIRDRTGHVLWGTNTWHTKQVIEPVGAGERLIYEAHFRCDLGPGSYSISPALVSSSTHLENNYEWTDNLLVLDVANFDKDLFIGTSYLDTRFQIKRVGP